MGGELPDRSPRRGGRWRDHRRVIEGIAYRYGVGVPWREVPEWFGPWQTLYERLLWWSADGTWAGLVDRVRADLASELDWVVSVDFTLVRVHQHGAALPKDTGAWSNHGNPTAEPADHAIGRSRGA
ncbi:transposase [Saccharothrix obliqua]|uniref:transposase n=1 Tax=Saccharothrix obliqua TaxID=2861747 RepID=UPI001C5E418B|nr:transposase [Saccharothrix obliqua]MBW4722334.1 transposase [Saccharothrix obliqua]